MRLLLITNDFPPKTGGIQEYLSGLLGAFDGEVLVLAPRADGPHEQVGEGIAVRRHRGRFLWPTPGVRRWIRREASGFKPDAVLFGAPYPLAWLSRELRTEIGAPVAVLCHGAEITVPAVIPVARQLLRFSLKGADTRLAVSRYTLGRVERLTRLPATYVGSGVDSTLFAPDGRRRGDGSPVVGCVSRFVPRKGQHRLVRAASVLREKGTLVQLLFVGSGRKLAAVQRLAASLDVDARFEIGAPSHRLPELYRTMDVFCMPCRSRWLGLEIEGLGIVYLEAAASGLPVLAGASGGAPETVKAGKTGFVVRSVEDIVESLEMLLGDRARAAAMGESGRRFVTSDYSWDGAAERLRAALLTPH